MLSFQCTPSVLKLLPQLFPLAWSRLIRFPGFLSSTMALLNLSLCPIGHNLCLRFAFFVFLRTRASLPPAMQPLHVRRQPCWHASTQTFSPTQTGSLAVKAISPATPVSVPAIRAWFHTDQIDFLHAGACGF